MSPWQHTVHMLEPNIDVLRDFMDRGPQIKPVLKLVKRTWVMEIKVDWGMFDDSGNPWGTPSLDSRVPSLDSRVVWTTRQLETWENVSRQAWHMWHFKYKRDAEKFITLYNLVWTE